jgi:putative SOS response-associated peptidase YedK
MCGRYQQLLGPDELARLYAVQRQAWGRPFKWPNHNVAPRQSVPVILQAAHGQRICRTMRWGFPPQWVKRQGKDPFNAPPLTNARAETAPTKRTWAAAVQGQRCLVPTTGFYEWVRGGKGKRKKALYPFRIARSQHESEGPLLTLGGVWSSFAWGDDPEKQDWPCMAILTTAPPAEVAPVHDRCPVVIAPEDRERWLDPATAADEVGALMAGVQDGLLQRTPVRTALNSRTAAGPETQVADWDPTALGL